MIHRKMKRYLFFPLLLTVLLAALLSGCKPRQNGGEEPTQTTQATETLPVVDPTTEPEPASEPDASGRFDPAMIPEFNGENYLIKVNGNKTFFTEEELLTEYTTSLSELDDLGRAHVAWMCADEPHIQTGERESIYKLKPAGWHGGGFYERSHLLMWKLSGINDLRNLVAGTATFNGENMQDYEKKVTAYLWDHRKNHVMYRVTPVYYGDELICRGVLMEAYSVEDNGKLEYCVFVYNAEPGATIDYLTGDFMIEAN